MINLGKVLPGSTVRIPFSSFDKDDGSSITMTNFAAADILVYKNGSTTERASTAGFTATTDFDTKTGKHLAIIDLADNTTADFFNAGAEYLVAIDAVTVDAVTTGGWIARFSIGYDGANLETTIATLSSQTSFTLTAGPGEDDALNGCVVAIHDIASAVQMGYAVVADYTGATKTITLTAGVTFTAAAGDNISFFPPGNARWFAALLASKLPLAPATAGRDLVVDANGLADANTVKVGPTGSGTAQTAGDIIGDTNDIQTRLPAALVGGRMDSSTGAMAANVLTAAATAADFGAEMATAIWTDTTAGNFTVALSIGKSIMNGVSLGTGLTINGYTGNTVQTGDAFARLGAPVGASLSADVAAVKTDSAAIKTKTDSLTFTTANQVDATTVTNSDKTGYSLTADIRIKKNTALANFVFLMVDSTDVPVTGATVTAQRSLDGAALAAMANAVVEISNGLYKINLAAADTNADTCCYRFTATGCKDRVVFFATQTE